MILAKTRSVIEMVVVTDPAELEESPRRLERARKNRRWFWARLPELGETHRGKVICVAGEALFSGDAPEEALALARAVHADDDGLLIHYIPRNKHPRVYAVRRSSR